MTAAPPMPVVSVVIPFYGRPASLRRALATVRAQDFVEPMETIVVNDGCHEDLSAVMAEFPDVTFIRQENAGPGAARNRGIEGAQGEFVAFLDADDLWFPGKVRKQVAAMRQADGAWSQHSFGVVTPAGRLLRRVDTSRYAGNVLRETLLSFRVQTSTVMVRRQCLNAEGLRFGDDRVGEDGYLFIGLAAKFPLVAVDEELGQFTWHGSNSGGDASVQLWSRARVWQVSRPAVESALPRLGALAYRWCDLVFKVLRYTADAPPGGRSQTAARVGYLPSYLVLHYLAKRTRL